jgi:type IV secretion system protein VirB4
MVSSQNFAGFSSLHNYATGYQDENHLGGFLMRLETLSQTPFYFNLHERASGRKDDFPKGHTTLIAPSNAGKTVLLCAIDVMLKPHGITSIFLDRNQGCEIYVRAMGGNYFRLTPGVPTGFNPCQLPDTPKNRTFLREFLTALCQDDNTTLSSNDHSQIADAVDRNYSLPFEKRSLSNLSRFFRLEFTGLPALSRYLRLPDRAGRAGELAYLFDNDTDTLNLNAKTIGFDLTHWLKEGVAPPQELAPLTMYLFHRIELSLTGSLTGLYLDEGWQYLYLPNWIGRLEEYLVTWRKQNAFIFFASQLPEKVASSPLGAALIQGSATNLFLPNPKGREEDYRGQFKLTPAEYAFVKNCDPTSRFFLIKQGHESVVARLNLSGCIRYISVLSGNIHTVPLCEDIRAEVGDEPLMWLPKFYEALA